MLQIGMHPSSAPGEARNAMRLAERLLLQHSTSLQDFSAFMQGQAQGLQHAGIWHVQLTAYVAPIWCKNLAHAVSQLFNVKSYTRKGNKRFQLHYAIAFYGFAANACTAASSFEALCNQVRILAQARPADGRLDYQQGLATGFWSAVEKQQKDEEAAAAAAAQPAEAPAATGAGIAPEAPPRAGCNTDKSSQHSSQTQEQPAPAATTQLPRNTNSLHNSCEAGMHSDADSDGDADDGGGMADGGSDGYCSTDDDDSSDDADDDDDISDNADMDMDDQTLFQRMQQHCKEEEAAQQQQQVKVHVKQEQQASPATTVPGSTGKPEQQQQQQVPVKQEQQQASPATAPRGSRGEPEQQQQLVLYRQRTKAYAEEVEKHLTLRKGRASKWSIRNW